MWRPRSALSKEVGEEEGLAGRRLRFVGQEAAILSLKGHASALHAATKDSATFSKANRPVVIGGPGGTGK